jgi:dTDP-4-dehydrorhamnose reductase
MKPMRAAQRAKVLVLGASGMLGNTVLRYFCDRQDHDVVGSVRTSAAAQRLPPKVRAQTEVGTNVEDPDSLMRLFEAIRPTLVINCVGVVKQLAEADNALVAIPLNAVLPHRLAHLCAIAGARLIHISTDCVFSGTKGLYRESDLPDACDLYGLSKHLGEVTYPHSITLRTSIIGHELGTAHGLLNWFLAQSGSVRGYARAIFSGLPTVELAHAIHDYVLPDATLHGVYHVSAEPIDKCSLLKLVAAAYGKATTVTPDEALVIDRSLDSTRFRAATGYVPPDWPALIARMHEFG